ncbi:hypothetical protein GTP44_06745 [Duganella sp. FT50W]|uniref:DUF1640 domain-containing protein n=1 Tax=Duganella lactea TaxID=2692173 RepID=A0A6L8MFJ4_9BURK|nr:hypothetical protein [Duganella lactea]MYM81653.1 hypothetical protein [Duganella lactea]
MDLEKRVEKLEAFADDVPHRLSRIEARLDVIEAQLGHMATKADLAALETRLIKWFIVTAFAITTVMSGVAVAVAKLIH